MNIIGISALYHDSACCLMQNGRIVAAAQEERFTRIKHDKSIPYRSLQYCLETANIDITDIDCVAYYESPEKKYERQCWTFGSQLTEEVKRKIEPRAVEAAIREYLGYEGKIIYADHHLSHAASAFYFSGFESAATLTVDGVGEWSTMTYGQGEPNGIHLFGEVKFPHSIGLLYSTLTSFLGFEVNEGEYKVMGLAPYGKPRFVEQMRSLVRNSKGGDFELNMTYFDFSSQQKMYSDKLASLVGFAPRQRGSKLQQYHQDIARSLQVVLEELLLEKVDYIHQITGEENLCMAGGVALNCTANGRIRRESPFKELFIQPAANDSGAALGAAALVGIQLGDPPVKEQLKKVFFGPSYSNQEILKAVNSTSLNYTYFNDDVEGLNTKVAKILSAGNVVGWFQGGMEFGPRALGARSILADPRSAEMRDKINSMVKKRENFRPFAPMVLKDYFMDHFDMTKESPFMLEICQVISDLELPAITHVDNSARVQTVDESINLKVTLLLKAFEKLTGCPILLNTSFNVKGEPIVCSPYDAIRCFINANLDCLVLGDLVIERKDNNTNILEFTTKSYHYVMAKSITYDTYTFL